jgi:hydroxymethylpyrimidine pyrophosphatase-like HAD family hydrolase
MHPKIVFLDMEGTLLKKTNENKWTKQMANKWGQNK